jgi:hypothetical protein
MPRRTIIAISAGSVVALMAIGVLAFFAVGDDALPAEGDQIAFSCKEQNNTWYAICVSNMDGSDREPVCDGR